MGKKLVVRRKGYKRKGYRRKAFSYWRGGKKIYVPSTYIKPTYIKPTTYRMVDKGKPGRTPKEKRWFFPKAELDGWSKNLPAKKRRTILRKVVKRDSYATVIWRLNALRNVTTEHSFRYSFLYSCTIMKRYV